MGLGRTALRFLVLGAVSALLVALMVRLWDEILRPGEANVCREVEFGEETKGVEDSQQTELDRTLLPGISIRS
jgi:hypothetical protein